MKFTDITESSHKCPHCGGPLFSEMMMTEKKDACYYKVKASAKVWPSAYASGRLVQCRKKGADSYGNKSKNEDVNEMNRNQQPVTAHQVYMYMIQQAPDFMKHAPTEDVKRAILKALTFGSQISVEDLASYAYGMLKSKSVDEDYNPEYDNEAGMADNNLETLQRAVEGIDDLIQSGDNLPEWCQEKIAVAKSMLVAVWDYMYSEEASDEVDPEVDEMFEAMQQLVSEMAHKNRVSEDLVWESFEALPDNVLYETAAWRRKEGKSKKGGLNAKGVASYRRENPGSKLQTAVTTKPSKLKPGSKAAKRRKSFCARMGGVKGPMKKPNGKPTRKALALRKWNC